MIVEPLIQGAGMRMYHPVYLVAREACDRYDVHLIHDEIAVGFWPYRHDVRLRAGRHPPRPLCLSKAPYRGYLPLAACLTTDKVYQASMTITRPCGRSCTRTATPATCWRSGAGDPGHLCRGQRDRGQQGPGRTHGQRHAHLADHAHVAEIRQTGMALAIEMVQDKAGKVAYPWQQRRGLKVF